MKKFLTLATISLALSLVIAGSPSRQRAIPINSSTVITISRGNTIASEALGAAVSATQVTLGTTAAATASLYNGLTIDLTGTGSCLDNNNYSGIVTAYTAAKVATISPASTDAADPNCSYVIGQGLPNKYGALKIGGAAGTIYYSERVGGTAGTDRMILVGGQWEGIADNGKNIMPAYIEFLSASATDTVYVRWE